MADKARTTLNDRAHCVLFPASVHLPVDQDDDHDDDRGDDQDDDHDDDHDDDQDDDHDDDRGDDHDDDRDDDQDDDHDDEDAIDKMILTPFHPTLSGLRLQQGQPV